MKVLGVVLVVVAHVVLAQNFCDVRTGIQSMSDNVSVFTSKRTSTVRQTLSFQERPHNLTQGECSNVTGSFNGDICTEPLPDGVVTYRIDVRFPPPPDGPPTVIYCIQVIDQMTDGTGGFPSIEAGGVGFDYVTLALESQLGEGMKFHFDIYPEGAAA